MNVGDIVWQTKHAPDGYRYAVLEVHENTVLAQPVDRATGAKAQEPVLGPLHVVLDGQPVFDAQGNPVTQLGPTGELQDTEPVVLNLSTIALAED